MYKACLWRKQTADLARWTHTAQNQTAQRHLLVQPGKTTLLKFHTAKQVENFTHQINDNLNKNLLKKPHHNNVLGPDHFKSTGPLMNIDQMSLYNLQAVFPTRSDMFP